MCDETNRRPDYWLEEPTWYDVNSPTFQQIRSWITDQSRRRGFWVGGIFGGRGTGKTSLMVTLLRELQKYNREHKVAKAIVPPWPATRTSRRQPSATELEQQLFAPARTRDHDDLLFLLLAHLERWYGTQGRGSEAADDNDPCRVENGDGLDPDDPRGPIQRARYHEVRRLNLERFLDYDKEVSPSTRRLPWAMVDTWTRSANSTQCIREAISELVTTIRKEAGPKRGEGPPVVLVVDDLDLKPHRGLDLLELLHLLMDHDGVVVLVCADRDLLLRSIDASLEQRGTRQPGLAAALLAKLVPVQWHLFQNDGRHRDILWPTPPAGPAGTPPDTDRGAPDAPLDATRVAASKDASGDPRPILPRFWPRPLLAALAVEAVETEPRAPDRELVLNAMDPCLPRTPRGLKALHNALAGLSLAYQRTPAPSTDQGSGQRQAREESGPESSEQDIRAELDECLRERFDNLQLPAFRTSAFVSMVCAVDASWPQLGLRDALETSAGYLGEMLDDRYGASGADAYAASRADVEDDQAPSPGDFRDAEPRAAARRVDHVGRPDHPIIGRLTSRWIGRDLRAASEAVDHLARTYFEWKRSSPFEAGESAAGNIEVRGHFLAVSLNDNALSSSEQLRKARFDAKDVHHLDLLSHVASGMSRGRPQDLREAKEAARQWLAERRSKFQGRPLTVFSRAQVSIMAWLGAELRFVTPANAYNWFGNRHVLFSGPDGRMPWQDQGLRELEFFALDPPIETGDQLPTEAVVIIDILGKSVERALKQFRGPGDSTVEGATEVRLVSQTGGVFEREHLIPALRDIVEVVGHLRKNMGIERFHLGMAAPDMAAFFIGQQLHEWGTFLLYEHYSEEGNPHYAYVMNLSGAVEP